jgi:hypothetical protein
MVLSMATLPAAGAFAQVDAGMIDGSSDDAGLATGSIQADVGAGGTAATRSHLVPSDFSFYVEAYNPGEKAWVQLNQTEQQFFFNRARCECSHDSTDLTGSFRVVVAPMPGAAAKLEALLQANLFGSGDLRLYAGGNGANCLMPSAASGGTLPSYCLNLLDPSSYTSSVPAAQLASVRIWETPPIPVAWLFNAARLPVCNSVESCNAVDNCTATGSLPIYLWVRTGTGPDPDLTSLFFTINLGGGAPSKPTGVTAQAQNEAVLVQWAWPAGFDPASDPSLLGVQLFCQRGEDLQVFQIGNFSPAYQTSALICPDVAPTALAQLPFNNLDPHYLCSPILAATTSSYRIVGLQNDIPYGVAAVAVDKFGNVSAPSDIVYAAPSASAGGADTGLPKHAALRAQGGCALMRAQESGGAVPYLLALFGLLLVARPRRSVRESRRGSARGTQSEKS